MPEEGDSAPRAFAGGKFVRGMMNIFDVPATYFRGLYLKIK